HLKAVLRQQLGGTQCFEHVGIEQFFFAEHLKLDESPTAGLARQSESPDRVFAGEASGSIWQVGVFFRIDEIDQLGLRRVAQIDPPDGDGDDFCAARLKRTRILFVALVLARPDDETRGVGLSGDHERFVGGQRRFERCVAAADEMDDFVVVAFSHLHLRIARARHDFEIALDCNLPWIETEIGQHLVQRHCAVQKLRLAVDRNVDGHAACLFSNDGSGGRGRPLPTPVRAGSGSKGLGSADLSQRGAPGTRRWCPPSTRSQPVRLRGGCFRIRLLTTIRSGIAALLEIPWPNLANKSRPCRSTCSTGRRSTCSERGSRRYMAERPCRKSEIWWPSAQTVTASRLFFASPITRET